MARGRGWYDFNASAGIAPRKRTTKPGPPPCDVRGSRAKRAISSIGSDGSGGIRVQVSNANDATGFGCVGDCVLRHEESHKADALAANAKVCDGSADASQLNFSAGEQKPSEIKASQVEIDCLNAKKPSASATCKPYVEARITQMIAYRDSFK